MRFWLTGAVFALLLGMAPMCALAGPPFVTDDPDPVPFHHWEFYFFGTADVARLSSAYAGPAIEVNNGVLPNTQLHIIFPIAVNLTAGQPDTMGPGDVELGVKYRFIHEAKNRPEVGIFPMIELPTGDANRGLGNGKAWYRLPIWLQKSWGHWTSYGGLGYTVNTAGGQHSFPFAGWEIQRDLNEKLTLGVEFYGQAASTVGGDGYGLANFGGYYNFNPNFSLLFSAGHTFAGEQHMVGYLGLYWTWGPKGKAGGAD